MKKNYVDSVEYLLGQEKDRKEWERKFEHIKTQGKLFETALNSIEVQRGKCRYILNRFYSMSNQLPVPAKDNPPLVRATEEIYPLGLDISKLLAGQSMTQDEMRERCEAIRKEADYPSEYLIVDFREGTLLWQEMLYWLGDATVGMEIEYTASNTMEVEPGVSRNFDMKLSKRPDAVVYVHKKDGGAEAYLMAVGKDGEHHYFKLNMFSILFLLNVIDKPEEVSEELPKKEATTVEEAMEERDKEADSKPLNLSEEELGFFCIFDSMQNILFTTEY